MSDEDQRKKLILKKKQLTRQNDPDVGGEITPVTLRSGPIMDRKTTDSLCCFTYMILFIGVTAISIFAIFRGNGKAMITPYDSNRK